MVRPLPARGFVGGAVSRGLRGSSCWSGGWCVSDESGDDEVPEGYCADHDCDLEANEPKDVHGVVDPVVRVLDVAADAADEAKHTETDQSQQRPPVDEGVSDGSGREVEVLVGAAEQHAGDEATGETAEEDVHGAFGVVLVEHVLDAVDGIVELLLRVRVDAEDPHDDLHDDNDRGDEDEAHVILAFFQFPVDRRW